MGIDGQKCSSSAHSGPDAVCQGGERLLLRDGFYELRSPQGCVLLGEPYATIFSHLMRKSEEEIEQMLRADL
jgi:hypothetical protein